MGLVITHSDSAAPLSDFENLTDSPFPCLTGSTISAELKDLPPEMFNSHLHAHTKKWGPINCNNKVEILTKNDDISIDFSGSTPTPEFLLSEFDEIPGKAPS